MYDLNEINPTDRQDISPYISYGARQVLRINDIELKVSTNTGSPKAILHMETKPIDDKDFTAIEGAKGRIGKVAIGVYMKTDDQKLDFLKKLKTIALALKLEDEVNEVKGSSFEEVVESITRIISGENKYARYTIFGEQYPKQDGKTGIKLFLPRYNFVEPLETEDEKSKLVRFDENNPQHFKRITGNESSYSSRKETLDDMNDLPF